MSPLHIKHCSVVVFFSLTENSLLTCQEWLEMKTTAVNVSKLNDRFKVLLQLPQGRPSDFYLEICHKLFKRILDFSYFISCRNVLLFFSTCSVQMQNRMAILMCNLKPAKMRGVVSQAMVMCASSPDKVEILDPPSGAVPGDRITFQGFPGSITQ